MYLLNLLAISMCDCLQILTATLRVFLGGGRKLIWGHRNHAQIIMRLIWPLTNIRLLQIKIVLWVFCKKNWTFKVDSSIAKEIIKLMLGKVLPLETHTHKAQLEKSYTN